jgi:hypothetical protein
MASAAGAISAAAPSSLAAASPFLQSPPLAWAHPRQQHASAESSSGMAAAAVQLLLRVVVIRRHRPLQRSLSTRQQSRTMATPTRPCMLAPCLCKHPICMCHTLLVMARPWPRNTAHPWSSYTARRRSRTRLALAQRRMRPGLLRTQSRPCPRRTRMRPCLRRTRSPRMGCRRTRRRRLQVSSRVLSDKVLLPRLITGHMVRLRRRCHYLVHIWLGHLRTRSSTRRLRLPTRIMRLRRQQRRPWILRLRRRSTSRISFR